MSKYPKNVKASDSMTGTLMLEKADRLTIDDPVCSQCHYLGLREGREVIAGRDSVVAVMRFPCRRFPAVEWKMGGEFCGEFRHKA
jgi:hypothetical protein